MPGLGAVGESSESVVERLFPHPPWPVVPGYLFRRTLLGAIIASIGVLVGAYYESEVVREFTRIQRDRVLWSAPNSPDGTVTEVPATVRLTEASTKLILYSITLEVTFDIAGKSETRTHLVRTLFGALDPRVPARVRFRTERPEDWSVNWAASADGKRTQALVFLAFGGVLVGGGVAFFGFALWIGAIVCAASRFVAAPLPRS